MYCKECGTELKGNELTCPYCGKTVTFLNSTNIAPNLQQPNTMPETQQNIPEQTAAEQTNSTTEPLTQETPAVNVGTQETPAVNAETQQTQQTQQPAAPQATFCFRCGQRLTEGTTVCSFCGQPVARPNPAAPYPYFAYPTQPPVEKKGTAMGIIGLVGGLFIPLLGIIFGIIAINQGSKTKNTTAVVLGIIAIVIGVINWIINIYIYMTDPSYSDYSNY